MGLLFVLISLLLSSAAALLPEDEQNGNPVIRPINHLGAAIHKKLISKGGNIFFSPISISAALGMLYYGARGKTAIQMRQALGFQNSSFSDSDLHLAYQDLMEMFSNESSNEYHLYVANTALVQIGHPIISDYKNGLQNIYHATTREVDFVNENSKVTQEINDWVKNKTHDQIHKLLNEGDLSRNNILVLLNAVFFKGTWKTQFDPEETSDEIFYNRGLDAEQILVPMMHLKEDVLYAEYNGIKILELPYKGEHISMVILLPEETDGLAQLEENLTADTFSDMRKLTTKTKLFVTFPKFKLEFEKNLKQVLKALGMNIFGRNADFSGISETGPVRVSKVIHKAVIEVNEEGSQASAVTFIAIGRSGATKRDTEFVINHPFVFAVVDMRSDIILFQGRVDEF